MPFLRFGDTAPIGEHIEPLFAEHNLSERFRTVYENSMAGALRIRARAGDGVAWLPKSLVSPDLDTGVLVLAGEADWRVDLSIQLYRNPARSNRTTRSLWSFLEVRQSVPLVPAL
jgi:DNA-binding transcriptional LysR family regulator